MTLEKEATMYLGSVTVQTRFMFLRAAVKQEKNPLQPFQALVNIVCFLRYFFL